MDGRVERELLLFRRQQLEVPRTGEDCFSSVLLLQRYMEPLTCCGPSGDVHFYAIRELQLLIRKVGRFDAMKHSRKARKILIHGGIHVPSVWSCIPSCDLLR